jgi:bacterioferritin-associated ferredoxin
MPVVTNTRTWPTCLTTPEQQHRTAEQHAHAGVAKCCGKCRVRATQLLQQQAHAQQQAASNIRSKAISIFAVAGARCAVDCYLSAETPYRQPRSSSGCMLHCPQWSKAPALLQACPGAGWTPPPPAGSQGHCSSSSNSSDDSNQNTSLGLLAVELSAVPVQCLQKRKEGNMTNACRLLLMPSARSKCPPPPHPVAGRPRCSPHTKPRTP